MYKLPTTQKILQIDPKLIWTQNLLGNYSNWKRLWIGKDVYTRYTYTQYTGLYDYFQGKGIPSQNFVSLHPQL